jgi:hypothetical protein
MSPFKNRRRSWPPAQTHSPGLDLDGFILKSEGGIQNEPLRVKFNG